MKVIECKLCGKYIQTGLYETGEEDYCGCQSTLDSDFDVNLWIEVEDNND